MVRSTTDTSAGVLVSVAGCAPDTATRSASRPPATSSVAPPTLTTAAGAPLTSEPASTRTTARGTPTTSPPANTRPAEPYYRNCAPARAAGAAPILRGQPGYRRALDADNDGIACE
jgi:hypothetical protein